MNKLAVSNAAIDPHAGVLTFADYSGPLRDECDVVVVGSGPGGAVVAKELAERGKRVVLVEEGEPVGRAAMKAEGTAAMRKMLREGGTRSTHGRSFVPTLQAVALGGGSLVNSAICCRAPDWALDGWAEQYGLADLGAGSLDEHYDAVEAFLGVAPTGDAVLGERNRLFKKGCDELGWSSAPTPRNAARCLGSGECFTGCRNGAKQSTDVSYVPAAIRAGARVYTSLRVEHVVADGAVARGVRGHVVDRATGKAREPFEIRAGAVVLAAGCMQTPVILQRSGLVGPSGLVGENLRAHPGIAIMGIFADAVDPWQGATQGYHSLEFLREGMKLEVLWAPPALLAVRFPGIGLDFKRHLATFDRMAPFDVFVHAHASRGRVRPRPFSWEPDIAYDLHDDDVRALQKGAARLSEIAFAAGAEAVLPGIFGLPDVLRSRDEIASIERASIGPRDLVPGMSHVFGTTRMGNDPRTSVADSSGRLHHLRNVWVADTSLFPDSTAVNPMLTCMALARRVALRMAAA